jgi:hypothetical protein
VVLGAEGRSPCGHLVEDGAAGPEVSLGVVLFVAEDLGGHVEGRAAEGLGHAGLGEEAGEAKVGNLEDGDAGDVGRVGRVAQRDFFVGR